MSHLRVIICRVENEEQMTELASFDLAEVEAVQLKPEMLLVRLCTL